MGFPRPFSKAFVAVLMVVSTCAAARAQVTCMPGQSTGLFSIDSVTPGQPVFDSSCAGLELVNIHTTLTTLPADTLSPITNLLFLEIGYSLQTLPVGFFDGATALTRLRLDANAITSLPSGLFPATTALTEIDLSNNNISELPFDLFDNTAALSQLFLGSNPSLQCAPPSSADLFFLTVPVCSAPPPPPLAPSPTVQVISDPHFRGFHGQTFDVVGHFGSVYSLVEDSTFTLRARFTKSYSWRDSERFGVERADADSKTWISEVGLSLPIDIAIYIGVLDADGDAVIRCPSDVPSCFASGVVKVNGEQVSNVGQVVLQDGMTNDLGTVTLCLENRKSFGRVVVSSPHLTLQVDVVLPKKEWQIPEADYGTYSHINLSFISVELDSEASGILGATQAQDFEFKNGDEAKFEVDSLL